MLFTEWKLQVHLEDKDYESMTDAECEKIGEIIQDLIAHLDVDGVLPRKLEEAGIKATVNWGD